MGAFGYNIDYYMYEIMRAAAAQQAGTTAANMAINAADEVAIYEAYNMYQAGRILTEMELADGTVVGANYVTEVTLGGSLPASTATQTAKIATAVDAGTYTAEGVEYAAMKGVGTTAQGTAAAGAGTFGKFMFGEVLPFVGAVATGAQVGLKINEELYKANPEWWWYNVENWDNVLLGHDTALPILHDTETGTTYITEEAFNNFMRAYSNMGAFIPTGEWEIPDNPTSFEEGGTSYNMIPNYAIIGPTTIIDTEENNGIYSYVYRTTLHGTAMISRQSNSTTWFCDVVSTTPGGLAATRVTMRYTGGLPEHGGTLVSTTTRDYNFETTPYRTINGKSVYTNNGIITFTHDPSGNPPHTSTCPKPAPYGREPDTVRKFENTIWFTKYGDPQEAQEKTEPITGIDVQEGAELPPEPAAGVAVNYPNLWNNRVKTRGYSKDKATGQRTARDINWVPVGMPEIGSEVADKINEIWDHIRDGKAVFNEDEQADVVSGDLVQTDDGSYPQPDPGTVPGAFPWTLPNALWENLKSIIDPSSNPYPTPDPSPNPSPEPQPTPQPQPGPDPYPFPYPSPEPSPVPDPYNPSNPQPNPEPDPTGEGSTPVVVPPITDPDVGLVMPYNPTRAQLVSFSQWLWSTNFIDVVQKLFASPADAIINLMELYVTPSTGSGTMAITCGYVSSGVQSKWINSRYKKIDCGEVSINESFGNIFDYEYTDVMLFLPFIGFVKLDIDGVMRSKVKVEYTVDVLTGSCLARVLITRDTYTVHSYSFGGNCGVTLPWSAGSLAQVYSSLALGGLALGLASTPAAAIMAGAHGVLGAKTQVSKSGAYGSNQGSMDCKVPFIVLKKNMTAMPSNYWTHQGYPFHQTTQLSRCKGFTKATNIHYSGTATAEEIEEIESILEKGIIL